MENWVSRSDEPGRFSAMAATASTITPSKPAAVKCNAGLLGSFSSEEKMLRRMLMPAVAKGTASSAVAAAPR